MLEKLPAAYAAWIDTQGKTAVAAHQRDVLTGLLNDASTVQRRIVNEIEALENPDVFWRSASRTR